jgi:hypothetical protein
MHKDAPNTLYAFTGMYLVRVDYDSKSKNEAGGEKTVQIKKRVSGLIVKIVSQE